LAAASISICTHLMLAAELVVARAVVSRNGLANVAADFHHLVRRKE
jgi:hypothetical protein